MPRNQSPAKPRIPAVRTAAHTSAPVITHSVQVEKPGFFSNVWQGFGLGAGQAIAHNLFMSKPVQQAGIAAAAGSSQQQSQPKEYTKCMEEYNDKYACEKYLKPSMESVHP